MLGKILTLAPIVLLSSILLASKVVEDAGLIEVLFYGHLIYSIVCVFTCLPLCLITEIKAGRLLRHAK